VAGLTAVLPDGPTIAYDPPIVGHAMGWLLRVLFLGLALTTVGPIPPAGGQTPPIEGPIYSVIYVEVMPSSTAEGLALLKRYREATRKEEGSLRCELVQRLGQGHQFVVLEVWKDFKAFETHARGPSSLDMREKIALIRKRPDRRAGPHRALGGPDRVGPGG
jgi:quinol monooxygenase YgiN